MSDFCRKYEAASGCRDIKLMKRRKTIEEEEGQTEDYSSDFIITQNDSDYQPDYSRNVDAT